MRSNTRTSLLAAAVLAGALSAVLVGAGPAAAHVTVNPSREATQGSFAKLAFRVPNERDNAATVKVEVVIPTETAIASVSVRPTPGWTTAAGTHHAADSVGRTRQRGQRGGLEDHLDGGRR